jgi:ABC-type transporter Mla subunit MlaD
MAEKETQTAGTPRWVKVFAIIALVLVVLVVVVILVGRGGHGPGRHTGDYTPSRDAGGHRPPIGPHTQP